MNRITRFFKVSLFVIQRVLGSRPFPYFFLRRLITSKPELAASGKTELVIEGYPRSANSFSVVAFEQAQEREVKIAHHLHVPAQVIRGVQRGIPIVVLLREPVSAVASLIVREPALGIRVALWDYIHFHRTIRRYRDSFLIARFEDITDDFGRVIERLNNKWGTQFQVFDHNEENVARAFARLESLESGREIGEINEDRVARPSGQRSEKSASIRAQLLSPACAKRLNQARELYDSLCKPD
ncbi:MAG: hypothetical protein OEQ74_00055 [Gammaproteobacteria bacterium]|nr:hypothetical protein [Gammaproteobacteria bacterium]